jgi:hypothetical protein
MPARITALLHTVRIMLGFGRHLAATAKPRAASSEFNVIAACFGTGRLFAIMAHLQRGILRATALENVLLARAARGRDIGVGAPRQHVTAAPAVTPAAPADPAADQSAEALVVPPAEAPIARKAALTRPIGWDDPELFMPTLKELEAEVRRRPLGRTLVDICLDLAVVPSFCTGPFWNEVFDSIRLRGGSVATLMLEKQRRQEAFANEQDRKLGSNWDWLELTLDAVRCVLGGLIGEATDAPSGPASEQCALAAGVATGPS